MRVDGSNMRRRLVILWTALAVFIGLPFANRLDSLARGLFLGAVLAAGVIVGIVVIGMLIVPLAVRWSDRRPRR
jgi:hypothetical protein